MYTLIFDLDYKKMERDGITEAHMLNPMREHSKKYGIKETSKGVFSMDGENALCALMLFIMDITEKDTSYIRYFKTWILKTPTGYEECKHQIVEYYQKDNIEYVE